jgi:hypothetical protein
MLLFILTLLFAYQNNVTNNDEIGKQKLEK